MIIGSCGYGATGSSVLTDLLTEYDDVEVYDTFEFVLPYIADGLEDLEYHIMKQYAKGESCDIAMRRFLRRTNWYSTPLIHKPCNGKLFHKYSQEFIDEITQCKFKGLYTADTYTGFVLRDIFAFASKKILMPKIIEKITKKPSYIWPCHEIRYSVEPDNFYTAARNYTTKILKAMGADLTKHVCLDQPFAGNAPENSIKFFENARAIVLDRDPRDLYLAAKYTKDPNFKFIPKDNVNDFITHYKNIRKGIKDNNLVLRLRFEDLIYNYDESIDKIERHLDLGEHVRKKEVFNPDRSINNTQLIRLHPSDQEDIKIIENKLADFLFPFENYENIQFNGNPFDGAERKVFNQ